MISYFKISWIFDLASLDDPQLLAGMFSKPVIKTGQPCQSIVHCDAMYFARNIIRNIMYFFIRFKFARILK